MKFITHIANYFFDNQEKNKDQNNNDQKNAWKPNNDKDKGNAPNKKNSTFLLIMIVGGGIFMMSMFMNNLQGNNKTLIPYSQFIQFVQSGDIQAVTIIEEKVILNIGFNFIFCKRQSSASAKPLDTS
jgi:ATP-dependent Zn protease